MFDIFDNNNKSWLTKLIWEIDVDGGTVEDEVVEVEVAIVAFVLVEVVLAGTVGCSDTMKKN